MPRLHITNRRRKGWYHLYNQGSKQAGDRPRKVFIDREDKQKFLSLLSRHLGSEPRRDARGRPWLHMRNWITAVAYCVMSTHFHLIVRQYDSRGIELLIGRVKADYTRYFNAKYGNSGPLFNGPVQSKPVVTLSHLRWLVGYVHKNWRGDESYEFASHRAWVDKNERPAWLDVDLGLQAFGEIDDYSAYLRRFDAKRAIDFELGHRRS